MGFRRCLGAMRYTILKHLASGGMAEVLLARSEGTGGFERHVVVKRIRAEHARDDHFISMFLDEARLAANLHHQNIVQVHDIGKMDDELFFAMEYVHGEDLRKLLAAVWKTRRYMPYELVCAIVAAVAAGLHYAHARGVVHRDVSPANILIGYDGAVKIADFGIAKATTRSQETRSGIVKGKVGYMSPEQCRGTAIDCRSDVWALGVVLYELVTMTRLFKGDNDFVVMDAIVRGKVAPPYVRRPDVPDDVNAIIMRALSVDPSMRFQTADEMRVALDAFASASSSALARYMRELFGERAEPWVDAPSASLRMAWEAQQPQPTTKRIRRPRASLVAAPVVGALAITTWMLSHSPAAAGERPANEVAPAPETAETHMSSVAVVEPAPSIAVEQPARRAIVKKPVVAATRPAAEPPPPPPPAAPAPTLAPAPLEPPKEVELAVIANATVQAIAASHAHQLAACEGTAQLHGDLSIAFQVDAAGKVTRGQLASSIANPKVGTCILRAVQTWRFPAPPSGAATGVYSVSYQ